MMNKIILLLVFLLLSNPCFAATYIIYYPENEEIIEQYGYLENNRDICVNIRTKHIITKENYKYSKLIHNINIQDKFIILPDKYTDTLYVEVIDNG